MLDNLTELEMRVLAMLEEAGEESVVITLNTVIDPSGDQVELAEFQATLTKLVDKKLIEVELASIPMGRVPLTTDKSHVEVAQLTQHCRFRPNEGHWTDTRESGPPYYQTPLPNLLLTEPGRSLSVEILESRGYQWWRPVG